MRDTVPPRGRGGRRHRRGAVLPARRGASGTRASGSPSSRSPRSCRTTRRRWATRSTSPSVHPRTCRCSKPRTFGVDREATLRSAEALRDVFGDILPARIGNYDFRSPEPGDDGFCGNFFFGLTWQIYRFIGNDGLLYWVYDAPEAIRSLMGYMERDRTELFHFLEREGLLVPNTDTQMAGPRAYGYCPSFPERPRRAGEAEGPLGLGRIAGDRQHLPGDVQGVRAPASRRRSAPCSGSCTTGAASRSTTAWTS